MRLSDDQSMKVKPNKMATMVSELCTSGVRNNDLRQTSQWLLLGSRLRASRLSKSIRTLAILLTLGAAPSRLIRPQRPSDNQATIRGEYLRLRQTPGNTTWAFVGLIRKVPPLAPGHPRHLSRISHHCNVAFANWCQYQSALGQFTWGCHRSQYS